MNAKSSKTLVINLARVGGKSETLQLTVHDPKDNIKLADINAFTNDVTNSKALDFNGTVTGDKEAYYRSIVVTPITA